MSQRFTYALQPVLATRQWELDAAMQDLAQINQAIAQGQQTLSQLQQEQTSVSQAWQAEAAQAEGLRRDRFELVTRYMGELTLQCQQQQTKLNEYQAQRNELIERVDKAKRALDAVEKHRTLTRAKFARQQLNAEGKIADDQWSMLNGQWAMGQGDNGDKGGSQT